MDILQQHDSGYDAAASLLLNESASWQSILIDNAAGDRIINNTGTLRHEDHRRIQEELVTLRRDEQILFGDIQSAGLTSPEDIGTMLVGRESISGFRAAQRSMNPIALDNNQIDFKLQYTPLPIITSTWRIPARQIGFGYKKSTSMAESIYQVTESIEEMIMNGAPEIVVNVSGVNSSITGYTTNTFRQTFGISDWTDLVTNGDKIISETLTMVGLAFTGSKVQRPNSLIMYVANDIWTNLQDDYSTQKGDNTFMERMKKISEIRDVRPTGTIRDGETLLVELVSRTIDMPTASNVVTIPHQRSSSMADQVFTTMAATSVMIKEDRNGATGIVHGTRP